MYKHSIPVWEMAKNALTELGGDNNWIQLVNIVDKVHERYPTANSRTIRCQVRMRCVNGHPGHDDYPDHGKMWREQPTFVSDKSGRYKIYNKERDYAIYKAALKEDGILEEEIIESKKSKIAISTPYTPVVEVEKEKRIENPIILLEKYGQRLGFMTQREWPIFLGRIDLVWYKELPIQLPQTKTNKIPLVGFEVETSWRTRKHIKGDILNIQTLKAPLGIILQQTSGDDSPTDVANLVRNSRNFLREQGLSNILIWTEADLVKLGEMLEE